MSNKVCRNVTRCTNRTLISFEDRLTAVLVLRGHVHYLVRLHFVRHRSSAKEHSQEFLFQHALTFVALKAINGGSKTKKGNRNWANRGVCTVMSKDAEVSFDPETEYSKHIFRGERELHFRSKKKKTTCNKNIQAVHHHRERMQILKKGKMCQRCANQPGLPQAFGDITVIWESGRLIVWTVE